MARILPILLFVGVSVGCRDGGGPPPLLHAVVQDGTPARTAGHEPPKTSEPRPPWIETSTGRAALSARERGDLAEAARLLDAVLARRDLYPPERAEASLLRGVVAQAQGEYGLAAQWFSGTRKAGALAILESHLRVWEAQAQLDAGQPGEALQCIEPLTAVGPPLAADLLLVRGDAEARAGDPARARQAYEEYLSRFPHGSRVHEARIKLARLLADQGDPAALEQAVKSWEHLALDVPLSDFGREALARLEAVDASVTGRKGKAAREFEHALDVARIEALVDNRRYAEAISQSKAFVRQLRLAADHRCRALYAQGTAIFKQRKRDEARTSFLRASVACRKAGKDARDFVVKSVYQAARGWYAEGQHATAARAFERLAKEFSDHSYADDAWILAGESWEEADRLDAAKAAYRKAVAVDGDMADEAVRRLMVMAFAAGDDAQALAVIDEALGRSSVEAEVRARLHYFRGRALERAGRRDDAVAAWREAVRTKPLGYAAAQALSRLRDAGAEPFRQGLMLLESPPSEGAPLPSLALPPGPASERAQLLARLGMGEQAQAELDGAGITGWPALAVLHEAGVHPAVQRRLAHMDDAWRTSPPTTQTRDLWEMAFPRPFESLVASKEREHDIPSLLAYAIMQTESRFDPNVTSWAGARGLIQLMPSTAQQAAREAGIALKSRDALFDPAINVDLGLHHLSGLVRRFGTEDGAALLAVPSYNAGAGAVMRWLDERGAWDLDLFVEAIPYTETRRYTQSVLGRWITYRWLYGGGLAADRLPYLPLKTATP